MMLKANGEYLDFTGTIEIDKKIKLFENVETADGDMSFGFEIELTSHNLYVLGIPVPDSITKIIYKLIPAEVQGDSGIIINTGYLKVESVSNGYASCSFLGGNTNWFARLDGDMTELNLSKYDIDQNEANIVASWNNTEGVVFPFIDTGGLITRGNAVAKDEDFLGCFYLKTLFKETFNQSGIKIQGELLDDGLFNKILIAVNTRSIVDKNANSIYVGTDTAQTIPGPSSNNKIAMPLSTLPFDIGSDIVNVSDLDFYVNTKMIAVITVVIKTAPFSTGLLQGNFRINDALAQSETISVTITGNSTIGITFTTVRRVKINSGDYISAVAGNGFGSGVDLSYMSLKVEPEFIFKAFGRSMIPLWSKQKFVSNILRMFNVIPFYNQFTKTVTLNIFDKIKTKQPIDISNYTEVENIDYSEFISNYAQVNNFKYADGNDEDLLEYNISSFIKYGSGVVEADNDYIQKSADVVELDLVSPISYINEGFNASLERVNYVELEEGDELEITSVSNNVGMARFNITNADDNFAVNDLARVQAENYIGDFIVSVVNSSYIELVGVNYVANAVGIAKKMTYTLTTDDSVYLFLQIPTKPASQILGTDSPYLNQTPYTNWTLAFFNLLALGRDIEEDYKQGLSFGRPDNLLSFQRTLIDKYWQLFSRIINDPVKLLCIANLPWKVYDSIDFLRPVSITTKESTNLYYVNRITGYEDSAVSCSVELIKLP